MYIIIVYYKARSNVIAAFKQIHIMFIAFFNKKKITLRHNNNGTISAHISAV